MSREIKFRFILQHCETKEKKVTIPYSLDMISTNMVDNDIYASESTDFLIIGEEQYIGLKDKNGNEIYDGDICRVYGHIYTVIFKGIGFWFKDVDENLFVFKSDIIEIIGNIHANPELI